MPSLRRTISSPSVRSSPYPSLSSAVNGGPGSRGNGHRRSSGSETSGRRVLADIEWWRVADGQRDIEADQETEEHNRDQTFDNILGQGLVAEDLLGSTVHFNTVLGAEHPSMVSMSAAEGLLQSSEMLPTNQFAALAITPHTPPRRHHTRESSMSSLNSTPEAVEPASFDGLRLSIPDMDVGFHEATLPAFPVLRRGMDGGAAAPPLFSIRAHSFTDFVAFKTETASHYADFTVSPLSASPFLCN